jgi:hypothetical protein
MKLQTKCTWVIIGLLIIEILPVPFTSLYSLYAIRKRPTWLPIVTHELYTEKWQTDETDYALLASHDPLLVRKNCTIGLVIIFILDLLVPIIIPTALYVVRRRPLWFKSLIIRLYSDQQGYLPVQSTEKKPAYQPDPFILVRTQQKMAALEHQNIIFAKSQSRKQQR